MDSKRHKDITGVFFGIKKDQNQQKLMANSGLEEEVFNHVLYLVIFGGFFFRTKKYDFFFWVVFMKAAKKISHSSENVQKGIILLNVGIYHFFTSPFKVQQ